MVAPALTVASTGNISQAGLTFITNKAVEEETGMDTVSFVSSKIDNQNSLLVGLPDIVIKKLQLVQNNAARLVLRKKKTDHVTPLLQ